MMSKSKSILLGLLIGGTVSATVTLLSTPASGKVLRRRIIDQSLELKRIIDDIIQEGWYLKNQIAKTSKEGVALINELTTEMKKSVEDWKTAIEPHQENIHDYLEQIESSIKDLEEKIEIQKEKVDN